MQNDLARRHFSYDVPRTNLWKLRVFVVADLDLERRSEQLLRFSGVAARDPTIDAGIKEHAGELEATARQWFEVMRKCGDEVRELLHSGCPVARFGDAPLGQCIHFARKRGILSRHPQQPRS